MRRPVALGCLLWALAPGLGVRVARAQAPNIPLETAPGQQTQPGSYQSRLGASPGAGAVPFNNPPGAGGDVLGGRLGPSFPRVPTTITTPGAAAGPAARAPAIARPAPLPIVNPPLYGPLEIPIGPEYEGPPNGLTLDQAIERLKRENLDVRSRSFEIPQAQADILTASLRANPILYADSQLIPYGQYSSTRPGGPLQYDLNITHPFDLSHKRQARTLVATRAKQVLEAQFQDYVRLQIDNLYTAFVDVLAAREAVRYRRTSVEGLTKLLQVTQTLYQRAQATRADVDSVRVQRESAELLLDQDVQALRRADRVLGTLLYLPPAEAERLEVRGSIFDQSTPPPPDDALARLALEARPDLNAYRLGLQRAQADVRLARANRFQDVYLLYQPYTFQNNQPFGAKSATSWALGMTVPLPVYNRNQGNIERARLNVTQTQVELAALERLVLNEVRQAGQDYANTRAWVEKLGQTIVPNARRMRDAKYELYIQGEVDVIAYLNALASYNDVIRQYTDTLIRHRRSMLGLNTAVGQRILP